MPRYTDRETRVSCDKVVLLASPLSLVSCYQWYTLDFFLCQEEKRLKETTLKAWQAGIGFSGRGSEPLTHQLVYMEAFLAFSLGLLYGS